MAETDGVDLKGWREARGLTLAAAASLCGLTGANPAETFRRYEAGLVWPRAETLERILRATDGVVTFEAMLSTRRKVEMRIGEGEAA